LEGYQNKREGEKGVGKKNLDIRAKKVYGSLAKKRGRKNRINMIEKREAMKQKKENVKKKRGNFNGEESPDNNRRGIEESNRFIQDVKGGVWTTRIQSQLAEALAKGKTATGKGRHVIEGLERTVEENIWDINREQQGIQPPGTQAHSPRARNGG